VALARSRAGQLHDAPSDLGSARVRRRIRVGRPCHRRGVPRLTGPASEAQLCPTAVGSAHVPHEGRPLTCSAREPAIDVLRTTAALQIGYR
jgi:hypothetical protein